MPSRRGPRWVFWPAKLLWAPVLVAGLWLTLAIQVRTDRVAEGTWRVIATLPSPAHWLDDALGFAVGVVLLAAGTALAWLYVWHPGAGRRLTAIDYPRFTWAARLLLVVALLATFRLGEPLVEVGGGGLDWRFLAYLRTTALDRILVVVSSLAAVACWILGWGFESGRWVRPEADAR